MKNTLYQCGICNQEKEDGIFLYQLYLCHDCEKEIVATNPKDERYQYIVNKLKAVQKTTHTI
ncbi:Sigma-G inhibitor, Gin [Gracilibacillus halophilus YIM-C55.5]|uniref:Sigma-G inhibitor, Gin n=1 Tax=Gracilibacillus halophilus YIM-C55.5 TaxID=1308866 RepID=N4WNQ7_9BACI|nr:sigma factor G inhibitor Gin [Gracilibacillus halophilus]ENH96105.1 Sigma-G inhibitor, Gin [Gracilibacillus halophilus YIM-C55.5]